MAEQSRVKRKEARRDGGAANPTGMLHGLIEKLAARKAVQDDLANRQLQKELTDMISAATKGRGGKRRLEQLANLLQEGCLADKPNKQAIRDTILTLVDGPDAKSMLKEAIDLLP